MEEKSQANSSSLFLKTDGGKTKSNAIEIPSISLPKGGGAIKGIDEKFSVNAANGTASLSLALPFSLTRGASPDLSISYNSGAGNSIFGLGWSLGLTSIKRTTDKRLPQYDDSVDSDTFIFSEAESLVPVFKKEGDDNFSLDDHGDYVYDEKDSPDGLYTIKAYRPRTEGLFGRIERWTEKMSGIIKWKVTTRNNTTTLFGWSAGSVIADPQDSVKIFEWLPEFIFDDKGNCCRYLYKKEDAAGIDHSLLHNRNRFLHGNTTYTNLYIERILYSNKTPYKKFGDAYPAEADYLFQTVFDYGEYDSQPPYFKIKEWDFRTDAFSAYKSGFEIRATRLCKRVLLFHYFSELPGGSALVRSTDFQYDTSAQRAFTFLQSVTVTGYIKKPDETYTYKSLPSMEFAYQRHDWNQEVKSIAYEEVVHAPAGIDEPQYQFTDLYNEGLTGILTEQATGWYYKHNMGDGKFEHAKLVSPKPSFNGLGQLLQVADLDADGGKQIVTYGSPAKGYFEIDDENQWQPWRNFIHLPSIDFGDPNARMIDLTGDGKSEILITEDNVFTWYKSEGRKGFSQHHHTPRPFDEEAGPHIVFADKTQTIFLADMSGNGLTDIVRIRNGEVCYWPNLGYGKFGPKVGMDGAPVFDTPDAFNPAYLRLFDIDGSGTTDVVYLGKNKFNCWMNLSGNAFSETPFEVKDFPEIHSQAKITVIDLLGNGVACIVWSSRLPKDAGAPLKYIDLMNSRKPHIMVLYKNNLGKEVSLQYVASTKFYLKDKLAGRPWITKLHFPVHCIARTETVDRISGWRFVRSYEYHHGYYDHAEKEFRGFGMVEQIDSEHFAHWVKTDATNIVEKELHQEPVVTKTWFHTGAFISREKILDQFATEYWYKEMERQGFTAVHHEALLPDARIVAAPGIPAPVMEQLSAVEWREALRACKSMALRSEVFAHDAPTEGATAAQTEKQLTPFSVSTQNCTIELIQPKGKNKHAVFVVRESESITYSYERNTEDPRIAHNFNIKLDEYGNVLESAVVVYPRMITDAYLPQQTIDEQNKTIVIYTRSQFTNDVIDDTVYRLRMPSEVQTFELRGVNKAGLFYSVHEFENILGVADKIDYKDIHRNPLTNAQKRLIEHVRTNYYRNNLTDALDLHQLESLAIPFETYQLAYTPDLVSNIYGSLVDAGLLTEGKFTPSEGDANWWVRSGTTQFMKGAETSTDAQNRFYVPVSYTDPYGAKTGVKYYGNYFLLVEETEDAVGNKTIVDTFNFRTLSPQRMKDINANLSEAIVDELGLVKAMAVSGKGDEADELAGLSEFTDTAETNLIHDFFNVPLTTAGVADSLALANIGSQLLHHATARFVYDLDVYKNTGKPAVIASIVREQHFKKIHSSPVQLSFEYSNGLGKVVMKKVQAEPGLAKKVVINPDNSVVVQEIDTSTLIPRQLRWIGNGRTILNNKGNPVKQYEPYFSVNNLYEDYKELVETGVSPIMYYDAAGRRTKTDMPNGSFSKVQFDSWKQTVFDANDTILESSWYNDRTNRLIDAKLLGEGKDPGREKNAADKAARHANTPQVLHFDTLGRPILSVDHNKNTLTNADEYYRTKIELDVEGNLRSVKDARELPENGYNGNAVMQYKYDMLGNMVYQNSKDSGQRWLLLNILGKPLRTWDERHHECQYFYDAAHRPTESKVIGGDSTASLLNNVFNKIIYGESLLAGTRTDADRLNESALQAINILGKPVTVFDTGGIIETPGYDFKGQPVSTNRKLFKRYKEVPNWIDENLATDLEADDFIFATETDALGRITKQVAPDLSIITPSYNETGLLNGETVEHVDPVTTAVYIKDIDYNEKGQRNKIIYGNDVTTKFYYDEETFRLNRLESKRLNGDPLQDWYYTYDAVGNITHIEDNNVPVVFFNNQKVTGNLEYTYDALYRLAEATGRENDAALSFNSKDNWNDAPFMHEMNPGDPMAVRNYTQQYQYDEAGNITRMRHVAAGNNWTRSYKYEKTSNRLKTTQIGAETYTYVHHPQHGFMQVMPHLEEMGWNFKEELVKSIQQKVNPGNGTAESTYYQYDGSGQRIRKITENSALADAIPAIKEERMYISGYELYRKPTGTHAGLERVSLSLLNEGHRFVMIETRNDVDDGTGKRLVRHQLHNHLGSTALELDGTVDAKVISYEEYHPFGTTAYQAKNSDIKSAAKRYRYTGMERDEETGLEYHSARYYLPWLGRWLSADPIGMGGGANVYGYCKENPVIKNDKKGKDDVTIYHRTTEAAAAAIVDSGVDVSLSRPHVWAGTGFYGSSSESIPSSIGASGDTIVAQGISTDRMADLDAISRRGGIGNNIVSALQDTDQGRAIRSEMYRQMYDARDTAARTLGRNPSSADLDRFFRDNMDRVLDRIAPNADVLRWRNPDGTFNYVVRRESALIGEAAVAGRMTSRGFQAAESVTESVPRRPSSRSSLRSSAEETVESASRLSRLSRTAGRRLLMALPVVDIATQQLTYEESAYTGDRTLDMLLNVTVAEVWEIPMAVYSGTELLAAGTMAAGSAIADLGSDLLDYVSREYIEPVAAPLEREISGLYAP